MKEILNNLGIKCREVSFWHIGGKEDSHACLEVKWHFFDPTYGLFIDQNVSHILSWEEISMLTKEEVYDLMVLANSSLANLITEFRGSI